MSVFNLNLEAIEDETLVDPQDQEQAEIGDIDSLVCFLFQARFIIHVFHLRINGPGAFAAHLAFGDLYNSIIDAADTIAEQYQGLTSQLIQFPPEINFIIPGEGEELAYINEILANIEQFIDSYDDKDKKT